MVINLMTHGSTVKGTPQNLSRPNSGREQLRFHYVSQYKDDPLSIIHPLEWYLTMK